MSKIIQSLICITLWLAIAPHHLIFGQVTDAASENELRDAVNRAIVPIEKSMAIYRKNRRCFSCHHHAHPIIALTELSKRGFSVDRQRLYIQVRRTTARTRGVRSRYLNGQSIGGGIDTAGYALLALKVGGHERDATNSAVVQWMLDRGESTGHWTGTNTRPPTQSSDLTRAWLCLEAFRNFGTEDQAKQIENRIKLLRNWLLEAEATSTEDKVARMRAWHSIGDSDKQIAEWSAELTGEQRDDGGWAQAADMHSDAYATGSVLMALNQVAGMEPGNPVYRHGVEFLKSTQLDDGTWHVKTRSQVVQEYFESGFPHGKDQFISFTATCWAATAIGLTFPKIENERGREPVSAINLFHHLSDEHRQVFQIRFEKEVWPVMSDNGKSSCTNCHNQTHRSSLRLTGNVGEDFAALLRDGFLLDDPGSILNAVGSENRRTMMPPAGRPRLSDDQIAKLRQFLTDLSEARID